VKFLLGLLVVSVLLVSACSSDATDSDLLEGSDNVFDDDFEYGYDDDFYDDDFEEDILFDLVDPDEYVEIGEMI
jgi:hypothetical protein